MSPKDDPVAPKPPDDPADDFGFDVPSMPAEFEGGGGFDNASAPFATGFGASPAPSGTLLGRPREDDTPTRAQSIYNTAPTGEDVSVIDAAALGRALAEAEGKKIEDTPDLAPLRNGLIGIDLGAALAVVARFNADGKHEVVPNEDNELGTPATVFLDEDGEELVGKEARRLAPSAPERTFAEVKLSLGAKPAEGAPDSETVASFVLKRLVKDVERQTDALPTHAAVAAPAWFTDAQRAALGRAVEKCGVKLVGVTDEALAAAVPYSLRLEDLNPRIACVVDVGHAALGCAFVRCAQGDIEILKTEARLDLGSRRWDEVLVEEAAGKFKAQYGFDPRDEKGPALDLRLRAEEAKKNLSSRTAFTLVVQARGKVLKVGFQRAAFELAATVLVNEARSLIEKLRAAAGVATWTDVNALIITGGGSRMPMIRKMLRDLTGLEPERGMNPDEGVAIGALYWGLLARWRQGGA